MKLEFSDVQKIQDWLENVVTTPKYDLYYDTGDRRLYAIKNVSTEPRLHGYVDDVDVDEAGDLSAKIGRPMTPVPSFEWDHDSAESRR